MLSLLDDLMVGCISNLLLFAGDPVSVTSFSSAVSSWYISDLCCGSSWRNEDRSFVSKTGKSFSPASKSECFKSSLQLFQAGDYVPGSVRDLNILPKYQNCATIFVKLDFCPC